MASSGPKDIINKFQTRRDVVEVDGYKFRMRTPTAEEVIHLRERMTKEWDGEGVGNTAFEKNFALFGNCIRLCMEDQSELEGFDPKDMINLVRASGGEDGDLTRVSLEMCGFGGIYANRNPTS